MSYNTINIEYIYSHTFIRESRRSNAGRYRGVGRYYRKIGACSQWMMSYYSIIHIM